MVSDSRPENQPQRSLVVLIGGVSGTGKTTVANELVRELGLSHHLSTGFIRAAITHFLPGPEGRLLQKHTYDAYQALTGSVFSDRSPLLEGAVQQSILLKPAIESCIGRAAREGIGMVLEGSHFIPGILDMPGLAVDVQCILDVPDREELKFRALSPNHSRRRLSDEQLERLIELQEEILGLARLHGHPVVVNDDLSEALKQVRSLVAVHP